jgi:DNA repair exonuclease SbcCD ATPase subunit
MADEIKFSEEELKSLQELSQGYQRVQASFGQLSVQRLMLEQQMKAADEAHTQLESDWGANQEKERELVKELNEKYGLGSLDPETGVFTPTPVEEQPAAEESPEA